jgi:Domain of unknown function (DUF222)
MANHDDSSRDSGSDSVLRDAALVVLRSVVDDAATRTADLSDIELLTVMERVSTAAQAIQAMAILAMTEEAQRSAGSVTANGRLVPDPEFVPDEVSLALHCSPAAAQRRCQVARDAAAHGALMMGWAAGSVSPASVQVITEAVGVLDPTASTTDELVTLAADYAREHTPSQTRAWLTRRVAEVDPDAAERRRERAFADRKVVYFPGADSMAGLWALLPAVQARQIYDTVNAVALTGGSDDARTMDQRRADALVDLVVGRAQPPQVSIQVITSAESLAGVGSETAEVVGAGPVLSTDVSGLLAELESQPMYQLLRSDVGGGLCELSEQPYRPSTRLRRAVKARDVVCRFPGCRRAASSAGTDLDHTVPWPLGQTSPENLAVLCRRHHRLKHSPGWDVALDADGYMTWTTPDGKQFSTTAWLYQDARAP